MVSMSGLDLSFLRNKLVEAPKPVKKKRGRSAKKVN
jgi:hypothetical protein